MFSNTQPPATDAPAFRVTEVDLAADLCERRRRAIDEAVAEAATARVSDPDSWEPAIALRGYGDGCLALALAGAFDRAGTERVRALGRDLALSASTELVVDLSQLTSSDPPLIRALLGLRMQRLVTGVRVELRSPPAALVAELGAAPAESYSVRDDPAPVPDQR
jgi:STAS domain